MFFEPDRTQFDLSFRLFRIPVRVHPLFWLLTAILGWDLARGNFGILLLWVACVFFSILIHELGHVLAGISFGSFGHIILYGFGGLAVGSSNLARRWQRVIVYLAGPAAQFVLLGIVLIIEHVLPLTGLGPSPWILMRSLGFLYVINLFWPLLNLIPIWPLDGGRVSREFFEWLSPGRGIRASLILSLALAGLLAVHSLCTEYDRPLIPFLDIGGMYTAILFALIALANYQELQAARNTYPREEVPDERWR